LRDDTRPFRGCVATINLSLGMEQAKPRRARADAPARRVYVGTSFGKNIKKKTTCGLDPVALQPIKGNVKNTERVDMCLARAL
jgi:hypothetical protein